MKYFSNHPNLVQNKINALLFTWPELDICLEYVYELVLMLLPCYEDVFEYVKEFRKDYKCESYYLDLRCTEITDITSLSTLTNLTELYLCGTKITDITSLATITNLTVLDLRYTKITDISSLATLTNLTSLYLDNTKITDIKVLDHLKPKLIIHH